MYKKYTFITKKNQVKTSKKQTKPTVKTHRKQHSNKKKIISKITESAFAQGYWQKNKDKTKTKQDETKQNKKKKTITHWQKKTLQNKNKEN